VTLDEMARLIGGPKATVHRALGTLCRAGFANQDGRGHYILGDDFLRMAFEHHQARPEHVRARPPTPRTASGVGKALLAWQLADLAAGTEWVGGEPLERKTPNTPLR
jgi:IclR family transcriptional regulator, acetate operon repressor